MEKTKTIKKFDREKYKSIIEDLNQRIAKRQYYGMRIVTALKDSVVMHWSNGSATWLTFGTVNEGEQERLDANQILAPYSYEILREVIPYLDQLPLYAYSFEGKQKSGKTSIDWALKQLESKFKNQDGEE
jgi:hypothetical protein